jgi:23S rRNA pseudouridine2604 synthase
MAELGICSRREADEWIEHGWVSVQGQTAGLGLKVDAQLQAIHIAVTSQARTQQARQLTILLHKPIGYVSGQAEDGHEPAVVLVTPQNRWAEDRSNLQLPRGGLRGLAPAGRLDIDSTGLLVLTQDGRIARQLIGEDSEVEKEYLVRVQIASHTYPLEQRRARGDAVATASLPRPSSRERVDDKSNGDHANAPRHLLPPKKLALLRHGLVLDGKPLKPAQVEWINDHQLRFVLREGKKRQIRRMCELVGLKVTGLKRVRIGRIMLGHLPPGKWRILAPGEAI